MGSSFCMGLWAWLLLNIKCGDVLSSAEGERRIWSSGDGTHIVLGLKDALVALGATDVGLTGFRF